MSSHINSRRGRLPAKIAAHIQNVALHHTLFDLPFAYAGALLASRGRVSLWTIILITVALTAARAAALAIDNLVDLPYDKKHPRFAKRPMVTGALTKSDAWRFILLNLAIMIIAVAFLPSICLKLLPLAALPFIIYPYMKRLTCLCHAVLGIAIAMAPAGGYMAAGGTIDFDLVILASAVGLWIGSFDAIYGTQDIKFDRANGLHSLAVTFGAERTFRLAALGHIISILLFLVLGWRLSLAFPYYIGIAIAALTLAYQHHIADARDFSWLTQIYFLRNGIVSVAIFAFTWLSF